MAVQLWANNAVSTLGASLSNVATSLTLASGAGALFPSPTGGDWFILTLTDAGESVFEIVKCTARTGDVLTVTRAQESSTALSWASGDKAEVRITKGFLEGLTSGVTSGVTHEYVSCDGAQAGSGVAANTAYTPTVPVTDSNGSLFPAVAITSTTATTVTQYTLALGAALGPKDLVLIEWSPALTNVWLPLSAGAPVANGAYGNGIYTGMMIGQATSASHVKVYFSNAGRQQGAGYGVSSATWQQMLSAGYRWRIHIVRG